MNVRLELVTRENWEEALKVRVSDLQSCFVPSVAVSLAKVYIKPDGEQVEYIPFAIYEKEVIVGFIMFAFEEDTTDMYWINGFIVDEGVQGSGYGRAALAAMVDWIVSRYKKCKEIRLTVHKANLVARGLYESFGFRPTGDSYGGEEVMFLSVRDRIGEGGN